MTLQQRERIGSIIRSVVVIAIALICAVPLYVIVINTFKSSAEMSMDPIGLPKTWNFENYTYAFGHLPIVNAFKNTIIVTVVGVGLQVLFGALAAYVIIFISAAVAWRWPYLADVRAGRRKKADFSIYGGLLRVQPGVLPIRIVLLLLLVFAACASCFEWLFPWAATNIPALQEMSNYTAI